MGKSIVEKIADEIKDVVKPKAAKVEKPKAAKVEKPVVKKFKSSIPTKGKRFLNMATVDFKKGVAEVTVDKKPYKVLVGLKRRITGIEALNGRQIYIRDYKSIAFDKKNSTRTSATSLTNWLSGKSNL